MATDFSETRTLSERVEEILEEFKRDQSVRNLATALARTEDALDARDRQLAALRSKDCRWCGWNEQRGAAGDDAREMNLVARAEHAEACCEELKSKNTVLAMEKAELQADLGEQAQALAQLRTALLNFGKRDKRGRHCWCGVAFGADAEHSWACNEALAALKAQE